MKKIIKRLIWLVIIALIIFGVYKWKFQKNAEIPEGTKVSLGSVTKTISVNATLTPEVYANIGAETLSEVKEVKVKVGDTVQKDDVLAVLDRSALWTQIASAKLAVESAVASEQEARSDASRSTKAQRLNLKNASEQARQRLSELYVLSSKGVLTSPINGVISVMNARLGEVVTGTTSPVAGVTAGTVIRVIDPASLHIEAFIAEADIVDLSIGQKSIVLLDAFNEEPLDAKIVQIDPEAVNIQDVIYFRTLFDISDQSAKVRPGMTGDVDIITAEADNVLTIPLRFIRRDADGSFVSVAENPAASDEQKTYKKQRIETGIESDDGRIEIKSGLSLGQDIYIVKEEK